MSQPKNIDDVVESYETGFLAGDDPSLASLLDSHKELMPDLLWELVAVDIELRIKDGQQVDLRRYLETYPELNHSQKRLDELKFHSQRIQLRRKPGADATDFYSAFPDFQERTQRMEQGLSSDDPSDSESEDAADSADTLRGRFQLKRRFAEGGLGVLWVADDVELQREVALKEIKGKFADRESSRTRFLREARITGSLEHPNIIPIYGTGKHFDGRPYYAMRLIHGVSLAEGIKEFHDSDGNGERNLKLRRLVARFLGACDAIHFAHTMGIVHRDIKPRNIMLGDFGETLMVDWGLAKVLGNERAEALNVSNNDSIHADYLGDDTIGGSPVGSPGYMSPEQAQGDPDIGISSDIYSLGGTLFSILTGMQPIPSKDSDTAIARAKLGQWDRAALHAASMPSALKSICIKAMSIDVVDRYPTVQHFRSDIERFLADEPFLNHTESIAERFSRVVRRFRGVALATAVFLFLLATLAGAAALLVNNARKQAEAQRAVAQEEKIAADIARALADDQKVAFRNAQELAEDLKVELEEGFKRIASALPMLNPDRTDFDLVAAKKYIDDWSRDIPSGIQDADRASTQIMFAIAYEGIAAKEEALANYLAAAASYASSNQRIKAARASQSAAKIYSDQGRLEEAIAVLEKVRSSIELGDASSTSLGLELAIDLSIIVMRKGETLKAVQLLETAFSQHQERDHIHYRALGALGLVKLNAGEMLAGVKALEETAQDSPEVPVRMIAEYNLVQGYAQSGRLADAEGIARKHIAECITRYSKYHIKTIAASLQLANVKMMQLKWADAIPIFEKALIAARELKDYVEETRILLDLAICFESQNRWMDAFKTHAQVDQAVSHIDNDHRFVLNALLNKSEFLMRVGDAKGAVSKRESFLERSSDGFNPRFRGRGHRLLLQAYFAAGEFDKLLKLIDQHEFDPEMTLSEESYESHPFREIRGLAHLKTGNLEAAEEDAQLLLGQYPLQGHTLMALIQLKQKQKQNAIKSLRAAISDPKSQEIFGVLQARPHILLARLLLGSDDEEAKRLRSRGGELLLATNSRVSLLCKDHVEKMKIWIGQIDSTLGIDDDLVKRIDELDTFFEFDKLKKSA